MKIVEGKIVQCIGAVVDVEFPISVVFLTSLSRTGACEVIYAWLDFLGRRNIVFARFAWRRKFPLLLSILKIGSDGFLFFGDIASIR